MTDSGAPTSARLSDRGGPRSVTVHGGHLNVAYVRVAVSEELLADDCSDEDVADVLRSAVMLGVRLLRDDVSGGGEA